MSSDPGGSLLQPVNRDLFRRACGQFATGVAIAGVTDSKGQPHALTVNSFTSVSLAPPLILICLGHQAAAIERFREATHFGISILSVAQQDISARFARYSQDRFEATACSFGPNGAPFIHGAMAALECRMDRWFPAGDHDIFVGEVQSAVVTGGDPLLYFSSEYRHLGS